jgi:hypothetical protein
MQTHHTTSQRIYVRLQPREVERLVELATQERRRPADQAALLVAEALQAREAQQPGGRR